MVVLAIVLKKARMIKKGRLEGNVVNGTVVETLVVQFEDLVQVVAKAGCLCVSAFWSFCIYTMGSASDTNKFSLISRELYFLLME